MKRRISANMIQRMNRLLHEGFQQKVVCEIYQIDACIVKDLEAGLLRPDLTGRTKRKYARVQTPSFAPYDISDERQD